MSDRHWVNVCIQIDWQEGGKMLVNEASAVSSDEPLFSAAEMLRKYADYLDEMSARGVRSPEDSANV